MKFEKVYRHGDVIVFKLKEQDLAGYAARKTKTAVLAYGEVTGHAHRLHGELELLEKPKNQSEIIVLEEGKALNEGDILFHVLSEAVLSHEEHDRIVLEEGVYLKVNQVEYDPFHDLLVQVRD